MKNEDIIKHQYEVSKEEMINKFLDEQNDMDLEDNFISNNNPIELLISNHDNDYLDNTDDIQQINEIVDSYKNNANKIYRKNSTFKRFKKAGAKPYQIKAIKDSQTTLSTRHTLGIDKIYNNEQDINVNDVLSIKDPGTGVIFQQSKKNSGSKRNAFKNYNDLISNLSYLSKFDWLENNSVNSKYLPGFFYNLNVY